MIVGFTGTRWGMTPLQRALFLRVLERLCPAEFHFGDDAGSDREAFDLVREHYPRCLTVSHPPINPTRRAFCDANVVERPKHYLVRNEDIALCCDELVATPQTMVEELRSGTWATIRYARKARKPIHILMPEGGDDEWR